MTISPTETIVLDDDAINRIQSLPVMMNGNIVAVPSVALSCKDRDALCQTVRVLRERLADAKRWQMSVEEREAAVCPEDVGFDEHIRWLQSQLRQITKEKEDILNRAYQTVLFKCGCMFKQEGIDAEPRLTTHCAGEQLK